jgi:hypothetical protein
MGAAWTSVNCLSILTKDDSPQENLRAKMSGGWPHLGDLKSANLIIMKGLLFLLIGLMGVLGLLVEHPEWQTAVLAVLSIWGFCRFYYFAFYVIEKYVDPDYKFSSLFAFARYLLGRRKRNKPV